MFLPIPAPLIQKRIAHQAHYAASDTFEPDKIVDAAKSFLQEKARDLQVSKNVFVASTM